MYIFYWIVGVLGLIYSIIMLLAILDIRRSLNEIIESGDFPATARKRSKKEIEKIIKMEYIENPHRVDELSQFLTDKKDAPLLQRINELRRKQA